MAFAGINSAAIVAAAVASFLFGAVWYGVLGQAWLRALGKTRNDISTATGGSYLPYVVSFLSLLLMAWVLAGVMGHLGPGNVTLLNGVISAAFVWAGFVATTMVTSHRFAGQSWALSLIDGGHWLFALLLQGVIIGVLGV